MRRPPRRLAGGLALLALGIVVGAAAFAQVAPKPAADEAAANRRFTKELLDSIGRTLEKSAAADRGDLPAGGASPGADAALSPSLAAAMRVGTSGIRPTTSFPANCMPIMGVPNTGINPLLANAASGPLHIAVLAELKDGSSPIGRNWRDGIALAAKLINATGGLLGRQIELRDFDVANPATVRAVTAEALDFNPFVVLGPVTASASLDAMDVLRQVQIPQFVGTRGLTEIPNDNPYFFRTGTTPIEEVVQLGTYLRDQRKARRIVIVSSSSDYGEDSRMMLAAGMRFSNVRVVDDIRISPEGADFRGVAQRIKDRNPDIIAVFLSKGEAASFLIAARGIGLDQPVLLDSLTLDRGFLRAAGMAANGTIGLVGLNATSPVIRVREMADEFRKAYGYTPSPVGVQGFVAMNMVKAVVDKACSLNGSDFLKAASGLQVEAKDEPGILMNFSFGTINNVIRDNFLFEIRNQQVSIVAMLPVVTLPF
jgi:branched-chain amino acid transport system substrate-binding protein